MKKAHKALKLKPGHARALKIKAFAYRAAGANDQALPVLNELLGKTPSDVSVLLTKADILVEKGQFKAAAKLASKALKVEPDSSRAHFIAGLAAVGEEDHKAAVKHYKAALKGKKNDPTILYNLGVAYSKLNKLEDAVKTLKACTRAEPKFPECWYGWGLMSLALGKEKSARKAVKKLKKLDKGLADQLEGQIE